MCDGKGPKQSIEEIEIHNDRFSESEYTMILIRTFVMPDQDISALDLVLLKLEGNDTQYKRVGLFRFYSGMNPDMFTLWIAGWTQQIITLI